MGKVQLLFEGGVGLNVDDVDEETFLAMYTNPNTPVS